MVQRPIPAPLGVCDVCRRVSPSSSRGALALSLTPMASADPTATPPVARLPGHHPGDYIVSLASAPVAAYDGDVKGFAATRPTDGRRVNVTSSKAKRYRSYLRNQQDKVAARVGAKPRTRFEIGLAGFTAKLTPTQAKTLATTDGVLSVTKNTLRQATDDRNSVDYLKLSGKQRRRGRSWAARPRPAAASWSACWTPASGPRAPRSPVSR